jgi:hypothetical protein
MRTRQEEGSLFIPLILMSVFLLGSLGFGIWAYTGRQDYKNNVDSKITEAVEAANEKLATEKAAEFAEKEKSPYKTYQGPGTYGSMLITYPKTWSAYVSDKASGSNVLSGYMHPSYVPEVNSDVSFALRFEIVSSSYDSVLKTYEGNVKSGKLAVSAYRAPKVESILGSKLEGEITSKKQGVMVLLPLRDKTIKLWTEGQEFRSDFNTVLKEFTFVP